MNFTRKEYETTAEKRTDFIIGVAFWFALNVVLSGISFLPSLLMTGDVDLPDTAITIIFVICTIAPWLVNIGAIIVLAIYRRWIAFGMLATIGTLMVIAICLGVILIGACSAGLLGNI